jgi:hypothetical protein
MSAGGGGSGSSFDIEVTGKQGAPLLVLPGLTATPAAQHAPLMDIDVEAG